MSGSAMPVPDDSGNPAIIIFRHRQAFQHVVAGHRAFFIGLINSTISN
jgi:hypothetical protein